VSFDVVTNFRVYFRLILLAIPY